MDKSTIKIICFLISSFLELFEPKEKISAHKWLYSTHKVNENQPPAIMAWSTVEDIMREKLSENWKLVSKYTRIGTLP